MAAAAEFGADALPAPPRSARRSLFSRPLLSLLPRLPAPSPRPLPRAALAAVFYRLFFNPFWAVRLSSAKPIYCREENSPPPPRLLPPPHPPSHYNCLLVSLIHLYTHTKLCSTRTPPHTLPPGGVSGCPLSSA